MEKVINKFFQLLCLVFISCQNKEMVSDPLTRINKLDDAANFLMLVSDKNTEVLNTCQISSQEALKMLLSLHALIDDEVKAIGSHITIKQKTDCEMNCHCGVYADAATSESLKNNFYFRAQKISKKNLIKCVNETSKWICEDSILKELRAQ